MSGRAAHQAQAAEIVVHMTGKLTISDVAARHLDLWADQVQRGELSIWQLPLAVQQYVSIGWADAHLQAVEQARDYEHQLDVAYLQAYSPKERQGILLQRLEQHFVEQAERFFTEPLFEGPALLERRAA